MIEFFCFLNLYIGVDFSVLLSFLSIFESKLSFFFCLIRQVVMVLWWMKDEVKIFFTIKLVRVCFGFF